MQAIEYQFELIMQKKDIFLQKTVNFDLSRKKNFETQMVKQKKKILQMYFTKMN